MTSTIHKTFTNTRLATYKGLCKAASKKSYRHQAPKPLAHFEVKITHGEAIIRACDGHRVYQDHITNNTSHEDSSHYFEMSEVLATIKGRLKKDQVRFSLNYDYSVDHGVCLRAYNTATDKETFIKAAEDISYPDIDRVINVDEDVTLEVDQAEALTIIKKLKGASEYITFFDTDKGLAVTLPGEYQDNGGYAVKCDLSRGFEIRSKVFDAPALSPVIRTSYLQDFIKRHGHLTMAYSDLVRSDKGNSAVKVGEDFGAYDVVMPIKFDPETSDNRWLNN